MIASVADWFVAGGTLGLAAATVLLVLVTKGMVARAGDQLALERQRIEASQRPHVYPHSPIEWVDGTGRYGGPMTWREALPLRNGGPGVALNVRGRLHFPPPSGVFVNVVGTSLAPQESADLRFNWGGGPTEEGWGRARGYLLYEDIAGVTWRTDYRFHEDVRRYLEVLQSGRLDDLGDIEQDFPPADFD